MLATELGNSALLKQRATVAS